MPPTFNYVMLVDDDENANMISEIRLKRSSFCEQIITVTNGQEAIDYFESQINLPKDQQKIPTIIFLDLNMPVMDGWNFMKEFGEKYNKYFPNCTIIVLSSTIDPVETERASFEPLVMGFIQKPLMGAHLLKLKNSRMLRDEFQIKID
ncbi:MAG: response regulator [bacterium]|nr:response regulator [bacterium]